MSSLILIAFFSFSAVSLDIDSLRPGIINTLSAGSSNYKKRVKQTKEILSVFSEENLKLFSDKSCPQKMFSKPDYQLYLSLGYKMISLSVQKNEDNVKFRTVFTKNTKIPTHNYEDTEILTGSVTHECCI